MAKQFNSTSSSVLTFRLVKDVLISVLVGAVIGFIIALVTSKSEGSNTYLSLFMIVGIALVFAYRALASFLYYKNLGFNLGSNSLELRTGTFSVGSNSLPYSSISDSSYTQGIFQRIFGVGDLSIEQEDGDNFTLKDIDSGSSRIILDSVSKKSNVESIKLNK